MKRNILVEIISALLILLFFYTATSKLLDFRNFREVLHSSPLIGRFSNFVVWTIPFAEIIASLLLFFPATRRKGLWCSLALMIIFTGYLTYMVFFSIIRPCNCGGVLRQMTWTQHLIFNIFFTLLAGIGLCLDKRILMKKKTIAFS